MTIKNIRQISMSDQSKNQFLLILENPTIGKILELKQ